MRDLRDKVAVVTGGATGYGYGTACCLAKLGMKVIITGRRKDVLEKAAKEIGASFLVADVTNSEDWNKVAELAGENWEILVNNAGAGGHIAKITEQSDEEINQTLSANLNGTILGCKRASQIMTARKSGLIINISSVCAYYGWTNWAVYSAAKAGVNKFSRTFYNEVRPHGVRVTVITPSWGATEFTSTANLPQFENDIAKKIMTPNDMGDIVAFIANMPEYLEVPEFMVQPLVQEITPA